MKMTGFIKRKKAENSADTKSNKIDYIFIFSRVLPAIAFITVIYYMLGPSEGYLHSDCVDTMTWAQGSIDSGKLFSDTFNYPYLLPFGATSLVYPFMKIFGFTMLAYRLSMLAFMLLFTTALYFMLRGMGWNKNLCLAALAAELLTVSASQKLRELFWEHIIHYSLGAFLSFVLLALVFAFVISLEKNGYSFKNSKKIIILALCMALWSFFITFDGVTTLAISTFPVMGALIAEAIMDNNARIISEKNKGIALSFIIILLAAVLGALAFNAVASDISTNYGGAYTNIVDSEEWGQHILDFLRHWTSLMGADYKTGESITKGANILAAVKMAGSLVLFVVPLYPLFAGRRFSRYERIFTYYHWLLTAFILYGFIFGSLSSVNWRLTPIICSAVVVNIAVWKKLWEGVGTKRMFVLASSFVILSCVITACQIMAMPSDYGRDNDIHKAMELLEENDLDYGYATYWNANILTLISSSRVKVRDVNIDEPKPRQGWLNSDKIWYEDQPGQDKYFFLLSNNEYDSAVERDHVILEDTDYTIREGNWVVLVKSSNIF